MIKVRVNDKNFARVTRTLADLGYHYIGRIFHGRGRYTAIYVRDEMKDDI